MWRATALTLFPEMFPGPLGESLAGRALKEGVWSLEAVDIRRFAGDRHRTVDDAPFGGGAGMVLKPDVLSAAIEAVMQAPGMAGVPKVLLSPRGAPFSQARGRELAAGPGVLLVCGRFEGVDERVIEAQALEEISVGDFVLSGGEIAAMTVMDCCVRLLPGVMGAADSANEESFEDGLLEYPHYTRPATWAGPDGIERRVPEVLLSGHHGKVAEWRMKQREEITRRRRPDLWARRRTAAGNDEK
ncbi:tRNA (guanosine(37)-N1)-methyltransferase TrmD [Reyranella sp.]|uniref:tRNA (guanosine(37)-N1)-methyltransferase TrmD n=1 Tax=Reyranella sp. TaxID=1929291 RepID=UPI000BCB2CFE|nr:tRNA (guanosine(37)-N1)-methyltransferase TrmD [Reyranella sp.]OYY41763.1 MAG: tRNA (guanosine(37)-N1)-methyltransferase TrmD [Rhodospirillales bacterium 35-66-84]OYZ93631.1 MAG: tRNA (guanosine(37)-N1)-methyltransferase TrmD [Rhodospirillales bacterium 24-66-33]OZB24703.1 MAG: tRNA (guanosine(37)-N1)-methyltransferase TrmD [Rhodospirillales bacterium 39-66-50]HQS15781.1 tRNA (guanosine(37)-N1)-methyltransferase TrmD [Reyranella sp.]HQT13047.1 tRNA (guanosine(37)-N1)-methyltransferase TrmD 